MRCNTFRQPDGGAYAVLVCSQCNKNVTLEQELSASASGFGEGASLMSVVGSPRPPATERKKPLKEAGPDDPTL